VSRIDRSDRGMGGQTIEAGGICRSGSDVCALALPSSSFSLLSFPSISMVATTRKSTRTKPPPIPSTPPRTRPSSSAPTADDDVSVSSQGSYRSSGSQTGLTKVVLKTLASDIELAGGIKNLAGSTHILHRLLNQREETYGRQGDYLREQIRKKVWHWKSVSEATYLQILSDLGVKPFDLAKTKRKYPRNHEKDSNSNSSDNSLSSDDDDDSSSEEERNTPRKLPRSSPQVVNTPRKLPPSSPQVVNTPRKQEVITPSTPQRIAPTKMVSSHASVPRSVSSLSSGMNPRCGAFLPGITTCGRLLSLLLSFSPLSSFFCCCLTGVIDVDIHHVENNGEFEVFVLTDVNKEGVLHNGYEVVIYADLEDVIAGKYKAVLSNDHEIIVDMPSISRSFLDNSDELVKQQKAANLHCQRTQEAHDVARNGILKDVKRQTKRRLLRFSEDLDPLSNIVYSPQSTDGEIDISPFPLKRSFKIKEKEFNSTIVRVSWKVSTLEIEKRVVKSVDDGNKAADQLLARLSGMDLSS
jgi:hypothetical protein